MLYIFFAWYVSFPLSKFQWDFQILQFPADFHVYLQIKWAIFHEIMALFILCKHILQRRMRSHPVGLDVWFLVGPFVMCVNSEGSGETARMRRLTWAFAGHICDKYHNLHLHQRMVCQYTYQRTLHLTTVKSIISLVRQRPIKMPGHCLVENRNCQSDWYNISEGIDGGTRNHWSLNILPFNQ